jgi:urea transport system substrate-binding protein
MLTQVNLIDSLEAMVEGPSTSALRIGLVLPHSGVMGLHGPSALEAAILAADKLNGTTEEGLRPIEFVMVESGRRPEAVAGEVGQLVASNAVEAFIGIHTSQTLVNVERAVSGLAPYVFAAGFEETRSAPSFYYPGEKIGQLSPGLARIVSERDVKDWAIIGTDYEWPREARLVQRAALDVAGGRVVLDRLLPLPIKKGRLSALLDDLAACSARGVLVNAPGRDLATLLAGIRQRGLDNKIVRVTGGCLEENVLYAIGGDSSGNLYTSMNSFDSLPSPKRQELNERYRLALGDEGPVLDSFAVHCYDAVHLLAECDRRAILAPNSFDDLVASVPDSSGRDPRPKYEQHLGLAEGLSFGVL